MAFMNVPPPVLQWPTLNKQNLATYLVGGQRRQDKNGSFPVISNFFWAATHIEAQSYSRATPENW